MSNIKKFNKQQVAGILIIAIITVVGVSLLISIHALSSYVTIQAESGSLTSPAIATQDSNASNGRAVQFGNLSPPAGITIGLNTPLSNLQNAINQIGVTPKLINAFYGWEFNGVPEKFPLTNVNNIISMGSTPMITWQANLSSYKTTSVLTSMSNGSEDSYITAWAQSAKAVNHPIYLRLMHEFNGNWYPWGNVAANSTPLSNNQLDPTSPTGNYPYTNTPQMYVAAYNHVVQLFKQAGATNVQFIWCFSSGTSIANVDSYYPGDSNISWASMDGYNKNSTNPSSFTKIFTPGYNDIVALTKRPVIIAETGTLEYSGLAFAPSSKAEWVTDAYLKAIPTSFPHIKAINYFDSSGSTSYSYPIDSSPNSLAAFQQVYSSSLYQASAPAQTFSF